MRAAPWRGQTQEVIGIAWDDGRIASGSIDTTIRVRAASSGRTLFVLSEPAGADVNGVAFSPGGERLAAANQDGIVRVWDLKRRRIARRLRRHDGWSRGVSWSPDGRLLASSGSDGEVRIWSPRGGKELRALQGAAAEVWSVAWSPDGKALASGAGDGTVRLWTFR